MFDDDTSTITCTAQCGSGWPPVADPMASLLA
jgi:hypothetical protein